jgi:hypothetical protein
MKDDKFTRRSELMIIKRLQFSDTPYPLLK